MVRTVRGMARGHQGSMEGRIVSTWEQKPEPKEQTTWMEGARLRRQVNTIMETTRAASKILVIDGSPQECARKTMEQAGFTGFQHLKLASLGLHKGSSPATDENIRLVATKGAELLA